MLGSVVWGGSFVDAFCRVALASLLAPGNVPACVSAPGPARVREPAFLIATDPADRPHLDARPEIAALRLWMRVEYLDIGVDGPAMERMSAGHLAITRRFAEAGAIAGIVYPDTLYADGTLAACLGAIQQGARLATLACPRFSTTALRDALEHCQDGPALSVDADTLARGALRFQHEEMRRCIWPSPNFGDRPAACAWPVPAGNDAPEALVMHSLCWAPVLIDYASLESHDVSALEDWTIDGDYLYRNIGTGSPGEVAVPSMTDGALIVSLSEPGQGIVGTGRHPLLTLPWLGERIRLALARQWFHDPAIDPLKRRLFKQAVIWGTAEQGHLDAARRRAEAVVGFVSRPVSVVDRVLDWLFRCRPRLGARLWFLLTWPVSYIPPGLRRKIRRLVRE